MQWKRAEIYVVDRRSDLSMDEALEGGTTKAVGEALAIELNALAIVDDAVAVDSSPRAGDVARERDVDIEVLVTLRELRWEIESQGLKTGLAAGAVAGAAFAGGIVGGLVATTVVAATDTDVDGYADLDVRWRELNSERIFEKKYAAHCEREYPTLDADSNKTKASIVTCALTMAMEQFRVDLKSFAAAGSGAPTPAPVTTPPP